jgi:glycosyltransferase involved in cell wall biosynthesis
MKIAMVSEHASPLATLGGVDAGGQNVHVAELASALLGYGHEVTVYTRRDNADVPDRITTDTGYVVEHVTAGPPEPLLKDGLLPHVPVFARHLQERWAQERPDVVHAHFWMSGMAALAATRGTGIPVVQTFHALGSVKRRHQQTRDTSPPGRLRMEQVIGRTVARTIATSTDEVFELVRMGVSRQTVTVVPCGVDLELFNPGSPPEETARPRILSVGRLVERKGFDLLIRALRRVSDAELVIAGGPPAKALDDDPEAGRLRALAAKLNVASRVRLIGQVPHTDMPALLRSATVVACVPWYEPFGIVPLEAMACGVPVVATAVGGLADTVVDGVTGVLVPPRRPDLLALALNRLLADPVQRDAYGVAGTDRARSRYSWQRVAADSLRVYEDVVAQFQEALSRPIAEASR